MKTLYYACMLAVLTAVVVGLVPTTAHAEKTVVEGFRANDRTWYIGAGLGSGTGSIKENGKTVDVGDLNQGDNTQLSVNLKIGTALSSKVLFGLDVTALRTSATEGSVSVAIQQNSYLAALTFFPMDRGFFVRGGAGIGDITAEFDHGAVIGTTVTGLGTMAGLGYAFQLGKTFHLTLNLDYHVHHYDEEIGQPTESSSFFNGYVGFEWH